MHRGHVGRRPTSAHRTAWDAWPRRHRGTCCGAGRGCKRWVISCKRVSDTPDPSVPGACPNDHTSLRGTF